MEHTAPSPSPNNNAAYNLNSPHRTISRKSMTMAQSLDASVRVAYTTHLHMGLEKGQDEVMTGPDQRAQGLWLDAPRPLAKVFLQLVCEGNEGLPQRLAVRGCQHVFLCQHAHLHQQLDDVLVHGLCGGLSRNCTHIAHGTNGFDVCEGRTVQGNCPQTRRAPDNTKNTASTRRQRRDHSTCKRKRPEIPLKTRESLHDGSVRREPRAKATSGQVGGCCTRWQRIVAAVHRELSRKHSIWEQNTTGGPYKPAQRETTPQNTKHVTQQQR